MSLAQPACPSSTEKEDDKNGGRRSYMLKFKTHLMSSYLTACGAAAEKAVS